MRRPAPSIFAHWVGAARAAIASLGLAARATGLSLAAMTAIFAKQRLPGSGVYSSTDRRREVLGGWNPSGATANQLVYDLSQLIAQARHLDRSAPAFRGLIEGRKAELVGTGITCEPDTGDKVLDAAIKKAMETAFAKIGINEESIWTLQRMASGEIDCAGSFLWREVTLPDRLAKGLLPWCILPLEAEWLSETPIAPVPADHDFVRGVLLDRYGRAVAVDLVNPEQGPLGGVGERVPISEICLGFERRRARQALGEPRLVTLIERTLQDDEIVIAELKSARNASGMSAFIHSDELRPGTTDANGNESATPVTTVPVGGIGYIGLNDKVTIASHDRPSPSVSAFRSTVRGDMAAGAQVSRVWADRDGSAYNFANSKFDQIRTQQMVKPAHDWFGTAAASWAYERLLPWLLLKMGRPWPKDPAQQQRLLRHKLIPDVPPELDEAAAAKGFEQGFRNRITSRADFLGSRGKDPVEIAAAINQEELAEALATVARVKAVQAECDKVNVDMPDAKLHWTNVMAPAGAVPELIQPAPAAPAIDPSKGPA